MNSKQPLNEQLKDVQDRFNEAQVTEVSAVTDDDASMKRLDPDLIEAQDKLYDDLRLLSDQLSDLGIPTSPGSVLEDWESHADDIDDDDISALAETIREDIANFDEEVQDYEDSLSEKVSAP